jgi:hypothetical protein
MMGQGGAAMPAKPWPTIQEKLDQVARGVVDESSITVPPYGEALEQIRADLEAFQAQRRAAKDAQQTTSESAPKPA